MKKQQLELDAKREQLRVGEKKLGDLRCQLEVLNYAVSCEQQDTKVIVHNVSPTIIILP